jgi:hypothetical protein
MGEPAVSYSVKEVLSRIETELSALRADVHMLQLAAAASSATAVADVADQASGRARWALWTAALSGPGSALLTYWLTRH